MVEEELKKAEVLVYIVEEKVIAFVGLVGDYIAGLFVDEPYRGTGTGSKLISFVKKTHRRLVLKVYEQNTNASHFYERNGFVVYGYDIDVQTNMKEMAMVWTR